MNPDGTVSSGETVTHRSVATSKDLPDGNTSKRRQLPVNTNDHTYDSTYEDYASNNSLLVETEDTELGHNDDITDRKNVTEYFIHPVTSMFVYMKSATGGAPYVCEDCDYKTTVNYIFLDHMSLHYNYSDSDDSE